MTPGFLFDWPLYTIVAGFLACAAIIALAGSRLAARSDELADRTGWGEAMVGAVLLGAATSLPGIITSVVTAAQDFPEIAASNALGGIAVQTAFLAVADIAYRKANLEHAAASLANLTQGALLLTLLAVPLVAWSGPDISILGIHPATLIMLAGYAAGLRLIRRAKTTPMWTPEVTHVTQAEEAEGSHAERHHGDGRSAPWLEFAILAVVTGGAGFAVSQFAVVLSQRTVLDEAAIGGLFTAIATSLPELVTSVAAVRRGALTLAVGGVLGGNAFDTLFLAFSDIAYRPGSLYHTLAPDTLFVVSMTILMTAVLMLGLIRREKIGPAGIGFESTLILAFYGLTAAILFF